MSSSLFILYNVLFCFLYNLTKNSLYFMDLYVIILL